MDGARASASGDSSRVGGVATGGNRDGRHGRPNSRPNVRRVGRQRPEDLHRLHLNGGGADGGKSPGSRFIGADPNIKRRPSGPPADRSEFEVANFSSRRRSSDLSTPSPLPSPMAAAPAAAAAAAPAPAPSPTTPYSPTDSAFSSPSGSSFSTWERAMPVQFRAGSASPINRPDSGCGLRSPIKFVTSRLDEISDLRAQTALRSMIGALRLSEREAWAWPPVMTEDFRLYFLTDRGLAVCDDNGNSAFIKGYSLTDDEFNAGEKIILKSTPGKTYDTVHNLYTAFALSQIHLIPEDDCPVIAYNYESFSDVALASKGALYKGFSTFVDSARPVFVKYDHDITESTQNKVIVKAGEFAEDSNEFYLLSSKKQEVTVYVLYPFSDRQDAFPLFIQSIKQWQKRGNVKFVFAHQIDSKKERVSTVEEAVLNFRKSKFWKVCGFEECPEDRIRVMSDHGDVRVNTVDPKRAHLFGQPTSQKGKIKFVICIDLTPEKDPVVAVAEVEEMESDSSSDDDYKTPEEASFIDDSPFKSSLNQSTPDHNKVNPLGEGRSPAVSPIRSPYTPDLRGVSVSSSEASFYDAVGPAEDAGADVFTES